MSRWTPRTGLITAEVRREVAVITLDRPEKLNALTAAMRHDLAAAIRHFGNGDQARGLVLTGAGRAFSAGEDVTEPVADPVDVVAGGERFHELTRCVLAASVPTVAALNGLAVGGAGELTLCFDSRLGTRAAGYFLPENHIGLIISNAASLLLPRMIGTAAATRLVLGSARLHAEQAHAVGLIDSVVDGDVVEASIELIHDWIGQHCTTAAHLRLLRPRLEEVEAAMARETEMMRQVWEAGITTAAASAFLPEFTRKGTINRGTQTQDRGDRTHDRVVFEAEDDGTQPEVGDIPPRR